jgi:hypothetical protein
MTEKVTDAEILKNLNVYVTDGIQINTMLRDAFIEKNNQMGALKHQGSLDTCYDILKILDGTKIATLAEMRAEMKKAEAGDQNYLR